MSCKQSQVLIKNVSKFHKAHRRHYCDTIPISITKIIRKNHKQIENNLKSQDIEINKIQPNKNFKELRVNEVNIQMISKNIFEQLFKNPNPPVDPELVKSCLEHLKKHGIDIKTSGQLPDVELKLPKLEGKDIVEHFFNIGDQQSSVYRKLLEELVESDIPLAPKQWSRRAGWSKYVGDKSPEPVPCPPDDALIFDVEVLMSAGDLPTLACAVSSSAWYGWVSEPVANGADHKYYENKNYDDLIPLETDGYKPYGDLKRPRVVVGHNVSYDRTKVKEQYWLNTTGLRFMDTMSMHTCVSGVTSYQRAMLKSKEKEPSGSDQDWMDISSLNSLKEVYKLYCGRSIDKQTRDVFVEGNMSDVHAQFNTLMCYCSDDVTATWRVLRELLPMFLERFPHPVTLAGMLELGSAYLPVNSNWTRYIESAETVFEDLNLETRQLLSLKADEACRLMIHEKYRNDLWMWDEDWSTQTLKLKKPIKSKKKANFAAEIYDLLEAKKEPETKKSTLKKSETKSFEVLNEEYIDHVTGRTKSKMQDRRVEALNKKFKYLYDMGALLPVKRPFLPGYPAWYRKLCTKPGADPDPGWTPGANNVTTSMQITPKLLRLTWEGYPLYYHKEEKWGFLIPYAHHRPVNYEAEDEPQIPLPELLDRCPVIQCKEEGENSASTMEKLSKKVEEDMGRRTYYARRKVDEQAKFNRYHGLGVWSGLQMQGCCHYLRLPHKDGPKYKVGNPLAKDFLDMFSQNVLAAQGDEAEKVLKLGRQTSYWRNNRSRIVGQRAVWLPAPCLPVHLRTDHTHTHIGAIVPRIVVCGTLTRRASEPTWMTASNAHVDRVGSELRAMVQAPPGYKFIGADVDSQELWIAALLGDSGIGLPGGSAFGWSVLAGSKLHSTDSHSLTAAAANISRDHAKLINYARIYGAGQNFAERLLKQFNPTMTNAEAKSKAAKMFTTTKGRRVYTLKSRYMEGFMDEDIDGQVVEMTSYQATRLAKLSGKAVSEMFERPKWVGGTESDMFNKLEDIADSESPSTAFLSGRLSRALENETGRWDGTKHNWAVQSAAADFLHLMLASMRHLAPNARFCLSFHDEVRYMVSDEHAYETALALQLTNLFTRAFCSQRVGINDLPLSVAFFTSVEVDQVLRKESNLSCITPSNPHGLEKGYGIPNGESLNIFDVLAKCNVNVENKNVN